MDRQNHISLVRSAGLQGVAMVCKILADEGIPSAMWGVNATAQYGGRLIPLVCAMSV
jgi:hypothetical protein